MGAPLPIGLNALYLGLKALKPLAGVNGFGLGTGPVDC